jgi:hypothetical protein
MYQKRHTTKCIHKLLEKKENRRKGLTEEVNDEIKRMEKELNG